MSTEMLFSARAGRHERMLKRCYDNPLFGKLHIEALDIEQARALDAEEVEQFINGFRGLVQQVVELEPNAEVDIILKLKESLDKTYEESAGLAGDQVEVREMIKRLLSLMMQSMWKAVGNDAQGISRLEMEEQAREAHFSLLEKPFIADMLLPESLIDEKLLVPCLLSEQADTVALAMQLFEPDQQQLIYRQATELMKSLDAGHQRVQQAEQRMQEMLALLVPVNTRPG